MFKLIFALFSFVVFQSCVVDNTNQDSSNFTPQNRIQIVDNGIVNYVECSDSVYNGIFYSDKGYLSICDSIVKLNDSVYKVKISKDDYNKGQHSITIDDSTLIPPLNRFRYPLSSSILVDHDTLFMVNAQTKSNWIKWIKI